MGRKNNDLEITDQAVCSNEAMELIDPSLSTKRSQHNPSVLYGLTPLEKEDRDRVVVTGTRARDN